MQTIKQRKGIMILEYELVDTITDEEYRRIATKQIINDIEKYKLNVELELIQYSKETTIYKIKYQVPVSTIN